MPKPTVERARALRSNMTDAERALWQVLRGRNLEGARFRRQVPIGPYVADFASFEPRLVIECDGGQHGTERDASRDAYLKAQGFDVVRLWNHEVLQQPEGAWAAISAKLEALRAAPDGRSRQERAPHARPFAREGGREQSDAADEPSRQERAPHARPFAREGGREQSGAAGEPSRQERAPRPRPLPREGGREQSDASELRVFGVNACLAVFARRPQAIRKVYLVEARLSVLKPVLAWCAKSKVGYRMVEADDLQRLTRSEHHEGVVFDVLRQPPLAVAQFIAGIDASAPALAIWLDGVGNPHNFGASLRIAAHFGAQGVLLPPGSTLALSGAACRVAEGGAEVVPLVAIDDAARALAMFARVGFEAVATVVRDGEDLYARPLPRRCVLIFGAEGGGIGPALLRAVPRHMRIPGSGAVESLNIATAVGVVAAEFWRLHRR